MDQRLKQAIISSNVDEVARLIEKGVPVNEQDRDGRTALHFAAETGSLEIMKTLISAGADVNIQDQYETPPLYLAVAGLHSECVKELLKGRVPSATLDVRPRWWGHTALHLAVLSENLELVKELIRKGASLEVGTRLWWKFGDIPVNPDFDCTALHLAVLKGSRAIVKELIRSGASVDAVSLNGYTALHFAIITKSVEIVQELLKAGASLEIRNKDGCIALGVAERRCAYDIKDILIKEAEYRKVRDEQLLSLSSMTFKELTDRTQNHGLFENLSKLNILSFVLELDIIDSYNKLKEVYRQIIPYAENLDIKKKIQAVFSRQSLRMNPNRMFLEQHIKE